MGKNQNDLFLTLGSDTSSTQTNRANPFTNGGSSSISGWDTSSVTNMAEMLRNCRNFNQPIGYWNTSSLTNISYMLDSAVSFDQDLL